MDAWLIKAALLLSTLTSLGATYRTPNFVVQADLAEVARKVGDTAEYYREQLAVEWLGNKLRQWYQPCQITVKVGRIGSGGATSFSFDRGHVFGWRMMVQGSLERILDSVVPHEVCHTIFACHFRRPLPRWADEGAATLFEHESERRRQQLVLKQVWESSRRIPLRRLFSMKEYPRDMQNVLTLYAQGYSLADFLVQAGGKARYLKFLEDAHHRSWDHALERHYSLRNVETLEKRWIGWVTAGSPQLDLPSGVQLADSHTTAEQLPRPVIRSQSPEVASVNTTPDREKSPLRGRDLQAPDPRRHRPRPESIHTSTPKSASGNQSRGETSVGRGRLLSKTVSGIAAAINDGWIPIAGSRRWRPKPLRFRVPLTRLPSKRPLTNTPGTSIPPGFPYGRTGSSSTQFRESIEPSLSPQRAG